jgi:ABC-2 type transport system ATP-binding protein
VQALARSQPAFPMMPGMPEKRTHDYLRHGTTSEFVASASTKTVRVRTPDEEALRELLLQGGASVASPKRGELAVTGMTSDEIGYKAASIGATLLELTPVEASLEEAFMTLTHDAVDYHTPAPAISDTEAPLERTAA